MKHIFHYLGALLTTVLLGATFASCLDDDGGAMTTGILGIKTFFPTKVVTNQPMTISGSGFNAATEIEFPGGAKVTDFEIVNDGMIRVNAPAGIPEEGGTIVVRTPNEEMASDLTLTLGHPKVTGYDRQPGETVGGGELITIYGTDLEFINAVELLNADSVPQLIDQKDFYRKGTSNVIFRVPLKDIYSGTFEGTVHTYDGQKFTLPELTYEPAADEGHMEIVKTTIWKNDGSLGQVNWDGIYRFAPESNSTGEECYTVPQDIWEKMKAETFYVTFKGEAPQIRVTSGWWSTTWSGADIQPGNELLEDLGDGTYKLAVTLAGDPLLDVVDAQHLLFTGGGFTIEELYFEEEVWVDGPGDQEVPFSVWKNDGSLGQVNWDGIYRFAPESNSTGEECYTVPQDVWERMKAETFYVTFKGEAPQIRVTSGWWSTTWSGADIQPGNEHLEDLGDGTWRLTVNLAGDPLLDVIDAQHLLFTGGGFTLEEIYLIDIVKGGGGGKPSEYDIASFTLYQDQSGNLEYPFFPSWNDDKGKLRIMRGGEPAIETLGLTTNSKFIVYKEVGTTGQIQWNDPNWGSFAGVECNDWDGSAETIEVPVTEDMLKCISGEVQDGWSNTAIIIQGDGLKVTKIVVVP